MRSQLGRRAVSSTPLAGTRRARDRHLRQRLVIPLVLVLALGTVAWIAREVVGGGGRAAAEAQPPAPARGIQSSGTAGAGEPLGLQAPHAPESRAREQAADEAGVGMTDAAPAAEAEARVRVVEKASGAPVAGTRVRWLAATREEVARARDLARIDALLDERARTLQADELGLASVPRPAGLTVIVVAEKDELWGHVHVGPLQPGDEQVLELAADFAVDVLVRGPAGSRADLPVALRAERWMDERTLLSARTDAEGRARLPHAGVAIARNSAEVPALWIELLAPLAQPLRERFDAAARNEVILLDLPLTGAVEVLVTALSGESVPAGEVQLAVVDEGARGGPFAAVAQQPEPEFAAGRALFPAVGLDLELIATVRVRELGAMTWLRFQGPKAAGERWRTLKPSADRKSKVAIWGGPAGSGSAACGVVCLSGWVRIDQALQSPTRVRARCAARLDGGGAEERQERLVLALHGCGVVTGLA